MGVLRTIRYFLLGVFLSACGVSIIRGSGNILRENIEIDSFDRVLFSGSGELVITAGEEETLTILGDEVVLPLVQAEVRNGTLFISEEALDDRLVLTGAPIIYNLTVADLTALAMDKPGRITVDVLSVERILLEAGEGGTISIANLTADELIVRVGGTSTIDVAGVVGTQKILVKETGTFQAPNLLANTADVTLTESGSVTIWVEEFLDAKISGPVPALER